jgi:hypothetical protein
MTAAAIDRQNWTDWRGVLLSTALNALGMPLDLLLGLRVPDMPRGPSIGSAVVGLVLTAVLMSAEWRANPRRLSFIFLLNNLAILTALWITSGYWARTGLWVPFQANKLGIFAVAILAPDEGVGLFCMAGYAVAALAKTWTLPAPIRAHFPAGEPWTIVIYGIFGAAVLVHRIERLKLVRRMFRVESESVAADRMARTFLALRDFTNTPLQTIELATQIIRVRCADLAPTLDRIDRSLSRLHRLNHTFRTYEARLRWTRNDVSLDPSGIIDQELQGAPR